MTKAPISLQEPRRRNKPKPYRKVEIPKGSGKVRTLRYFETIRHSVLLDKIARRIQDPQVLHLVKQSSKVGGKIGVPQGGAFSPLAANTCLNEVDWFFDAIRRKTGEGPYEAVNYHRFADDIVITVSSHHTNGAGPNGLCNGSGNSSH